jgi:site-specific DNA-methyltransferase (adenine-specific)
VPGIAIPGAGSGGSVHGGGELVPLEVALAYHPRTLGQLLFVRSRLDLADRADRFLAAALTGILHGKSRSYLSDLMPNTFSMAPRYVRDFARRTSFRGPERDVFACLAEKLGRLDRDGRPAVRGLALLGDARDAGSRARAALRDRALPDHARLVVTSPPYLRVLKYGYYNWLRAWLLGFDAAAIDRTLDDAHRRAPFLVFLRETLAGLRPALADDAVLVVVIGDVEADRGKRIGDGIGLADAAWEAAAEPEGYRLAGIALDPVAAPRKMTKLWGDQAGRATKMDRILVMGASEAGRRRALAGAGLPVRWDGPRGRASGTLRR